MFDCFSSSRISNFSRSWLQYQLAPMGCVCKSEVTSFNTRRFYHVILSHSVVDVLSFLKKILFIDKTVPVSGSAFTSWNKKQNWDLKKVPERVSDSDHRLSITSSIDQTFTSERFYVRKNQSPCREYFISCRLAANVVISLASIAYVIQKFCFRLADMLNSSFVF